MSWFLFLSFFKKRNLGESCTNICCVVNFNSSFVCVVWWLLQSDAWCLICLLWHWTDWKGRVWMETWSPSSAALADLRPSPNKLGRVATPEMIASLRYFLMGCLGKHLNPLRFWDGGNHVLAMSSSFVISLVIIAYLETLWKWFFFFHFVKNGTEETVNLYWYQYLRDLKNVVFSQKIEACVKWRRAWQIGCDWDLLCKTLVWKEDSSWICFHVCFIQDKTINCG